MSLTVDARRFNGSRARRRARPSLVRPGDDDDDDDDDDARGLKTRGAAVRYQPVSWYVPECPVA